MSNHSQIYTWGKNETVPQSWRNWHYEDWKKRQTGMSQAIHIIQSIRRIFNEGNISQSWTFQY